MVIELRLKEYLEYIEIAKNLSPLTVDNHAFVLGRFCRAFPARDIGAIKFFEIEDWMLAQAEELSSRGTVKAPSTINTERALVRSFLRYCRNSGEELDFDPAMLANMKVKAKRKKALKPEEIIYVARQIPYDKLRLCVLVMFFAGLRVGEAIRLRGRHLDGRQLAIEDSKSEEPRPAFLPLDLADELKEYMRKNGIGESDRIFPYGKQIQSLRYERYHTNGVRIQINRHFAKHGIKASPHDLRHAFASMLHRNGADIYTIKEFLGHSDVRTTQTYIHMEDRELEEKHDLFANIRY